MKIVYDSQIFSAQKYGGVSRYFCEIASRIAKVPEVEVSITAPMYINSYLADVPSNIVSGFRAPNIQGIKTILGEKYPHLMMRGLGILIGDLMLRTTKPDIIHETYFSPYRLGGKKARRVLTIYDMIHEKFTSSFSRSDKTSHYKAEASKRADHIICISESTRRDVIDILGVNPDKTSVIYLGFDLMDTVNSDQQFILPISDPYLLYVGNRGGYKNFLSLLEVYGTSKYLKTTHKLICFGGGPFNKQELSLINKLGLDSSQVFQLPGDDNLLAQLYKHASAFIFPSLYEGFGIPPLEAMSYGCPVICSNTSSISEVVEDAGEYFEPTSQDSMRVAIERVLASDEHQKMLIEKGYKRLKYFSWDKCAAETLEIYKKLI